MCQIQSKNAAQAPYSRVYNDLILFYFKTSIIIPVGLDDLLRYRYGNRKFILCSTFVTPSLLCSQHPNTPDVFKSIAHLLALKQVQVMHLNGITDKTVTSLAFWRELFIYKY